LSKGNYWIISRRKKGWMKIGETIFNENLLKIEEYEINKLLTKLNETSLFDFDYKPQENDKLEINLKLNQKEFEYDFIFYEGKWKKFFHSEEIELMDEMEFNLPPYIEEYKGEIKNPFKNN
jgi:hypothetical protein